MNDNLITSPEETRAAVAFYRSKADGAFRRASLATDADIRASFVEIATSYEHLAEAVVDITTKPSRPHHLA
jgi:hypothetical protein